MVVAEPVRRYRATLDRLLAPSRRVWCGCPVGPKGTNLHVDQGYRLVCTRDTHTTHADGSCDQVEGSNLHKKTISEIRKRCTMTTQRLGRPSNTTKHTHTHRRIHAYTLTSTRRTPRWTSSASTPGTARTNTPSTTTRPRLCRRRCAPHSERRFHARSRTWRCPTGPRGR